MLLGSKWLFYVHPDAIQRVGNAKCGGILAKEHVQNWPNLCVVIDCVSGKGESEH